jgi:predicted DCC family thiol-disulfide oxidoreductase YuxK
VAGQDRLPSETTAGGTVQGWIFYDAECSICQASRNRWGAMLTRRGFEWVPLQTAGAADRLGIAETSLLEEVKLLLPDQRVLGGIDAWACLLRSVWWLWPLGLLLSLPGCHAVGQVCYRWLARHRSCLGGPCRVR